MAYLEILAVAILTLFNGLLAMSELALVSSRKSRLEQLAAQGIRGARAALELIADPSKFLSTVQIGITLVGIVAGAISGATLGQRLGAWLNEFAIIAPYGTAIGIGATVLAITYLSLILGELVPKRVALSRPELIAVRIARPMQGLSVAAAPAVWLLHVSTEAVLRALHLAGSRDATVTEDEVKALIAEGTRAGVFAPQEREMIEGVLRLADRPVRLIMTPRSEIEWIDIAADRQTVLESVRSAPYSQLLVCEGSVDQLLGVVHVKDLMADALDHTDLQLTSIMAPPLFVPEGATLLKLLNRFKNEKVHFAVVVDEYGTVEGIVTLTDVIEAIAGDLPQSEDDGEPWIIQREDGSWLVDGRLPTDEVRAATGVDLGEHVEMLAAFVLDRLGRIPHAGTQFHYGGARFEVVDMDGNRIDKVLISRLQPVEYDPELADDG